MGSIDSILDSPRNGRSVVMGILNVTPDSFSDAGAFLDARQALRQADRMIAEGADIIDLGAESTRPGSDRVEAPEQIARLGGLVRALAGAGALVSIDTTLAPVADFALAEGAVLINDVSAGRDDPGMLPLAARRNAPICLMHMLGTPKTMQAHPHYQDVVAEVRAFLVSRIEAAVAAGISPRRIIVDPGLGFGKAVEHNLQLLAGTGELAALGVPVLVGPSRKRFIGTLTGQDAPADRVAGSVGACLAARARGASVFRVHDVAPVRQALTVFDEIAAAGTGE